MSLDRLSQVISKVAPLLGGVIAGPAGAAVAGIVASAFGGDPSKPDEIADVIEVTPGAAEKLKTIELNHQLELEKLSLQHAMIENADRDSAREREKIVKDKIPGILALVFTFGYLAMMMYFAWSPTRETETIIMGLTNAEMLILAYYFGSANRKSTSILPAKKLNE